MKRSARPGGCGVDPRRTASAARTRQEAKLSAHPLAVVLLAGAALGCAAGQDGQAPGAGGQPPNIVLVMTDDQGYGDFGFAGNPVLQTPHLDALAGQSAQVDRFYVSPVCTPTRASLMTGRHNYRTRAIDTYIGRAMMEPEEVTIAELLHDAGYATGIFGKWHLGDNYPLRAMDQGFEQSLVHRGGGIGQPSDPAGGEGKYTDAVLFRNGTREETTGYCTDVYFDAAFEFMEQAAAEGRPFFAYIPTNAPHIDIAPTVLDAAGVEPPAGMHLDGRSLLGLLAGDVDATAWADRTLYLQFHRGNEPIPFHSFAAVGQRYKLVHPSPRGEGDWNGEFNLELYDLETDPGETRNLIAEFPRSPPG